MSEGKVFILVGVSGSGKSTVARELGGVSVSADHYFTDADGNYNFDPSKLSDAHAACLRQFLAHVQMRRAQVVVDNTNTTVAEIAPYAAIALAYGFELEILFVPCDPEVAHARNTHGVPLAGVQAQAKRIYSLRDSLPPWWPTRTVK
jgi:predicted kinase